MNMHPYLSIGFLNAFRIAPLLLASALFVACSHKPAKQVRVLEYADFGPQAMAYNLLGKDKAPSSSTLNDKPIYVVVYSNIALDKIKKKYASKPGKNIEYRYIELNQALDYLDENITKDYWGSLTQRLISTRETLKVLSRSKPQIDTKAHASTEESNITESNEPIQQTNPALSNAEPTSTAPDSTSEALNATEN